MSLLHPLFLLAALAVAVPVVLHLARRRTRQEQPFSSLLFLAPNRPRFERRRRIEHWLLLFLRAAAVALLAIAFARPFFSRPLPALAAASGQRLLVLLDSSASMRRDGVWAQALDRVRGTVARARPEDRVAVLAFDEQARALVAFEAWAALPAAQRRDLVEGRLATLQPGFRGTDLGAALVAAGDALVDDENASSGLALAEGSAVVLVSDLAEGSRLTALGAADWPARVRLRVETVGDQPDVNLGLSAIPAALLAATAPDSAGQGGKARDDSQPGSALVRVRVTASRAAERGAAAPVKASVRWKEAGATPVEVTLAPGETRNLELPARPGSGGQGTLVLTGDKVAFDNELHLAPPVATPARVVYVGDEVTPAGQAAAGQASAADARPTPLYFLQRAFPVTRSRAPQVRAFAPGDPGLAAALPGADLLVATAAPAAPALPALRRYLDEGRLVVLAGTTAPATQSLVAALLGPGLTAREAPPGPEGVLTDVDLGHPLLAPFAEGRAGDFSKIRFWKRRLLALDAGALPAARVLGRFDDGSPALLLAPVGRGQLFVLASSWDLADSQLALSSKLVPLLWTLLESSAGLASDRSQYFVGEAIPLPLPAAGPGASAGKRTVITPEGRELTLGQSARFFTGADQPGLYTLLLAQPDRAGKTQVDRRPFAVNLRPAESAIARLPIEHLERLGVRLEESGAGGAGNQAGVGQPASSVPPQIKEAQRQAAFASALENQQRPWRFVLLAVFLALCAETWLGARRRRAPASGNPGDDAGTGIPAPAGGAG